VRARGTSATFNRWFGRGWLGLGYVFLYVPIVALVIFSFNDSPIRMSGAASRSSGTPPWRAIRRCWPACGSA